MAFEPKQYDIILQDQIDWAIAHTNKVSDFNEGSINRAIFSAVALIVEQAYYDILLGWVDAMRFALQNTVNFSRKEGTKSTGNAVFSSNDPVPSDVTIIIGTIIATADGKRFITTAIGTIATGNTSSGNVPIESEEVGQDKNVLADTIVQLVSLPVGVDTVTNPADTEFGTDIESDDRYNVRFQDFLKGLTKTTPPGILAGVKEVEGVVNAVLIENTELLIYVDDGSGTASTPLLDDVKEKMFGDGTEENPGYRSGGVRMQVLSSTKIDISITATVYYSANQDPLVLEPEVETAISTFINSLNIGQDVVTEQVGTAIKQVNGVEDINITIPSGDRIEVSRSAGEIAKFFDADLTLLQFVDSD